MIDCDAWRRNPTVNPATGRKITTNGAVYKKLAKECKTRSKDRSLIDEKCVAWRRNPNVNPTTKRKITTNGVVYKKLEKECGPVNTCSKRSFTVNEHALSKFDDPKTIQQAIGQNDWFSLRLQRSRRIIQKLKELKVQQWDMCMSGPKAEKFVSNFKDVQLIGQGTFGQVFKINLNGDDLVVKEAYLEDTQKQLLTDEKVIESVKWDEIPIKSYPKEYDFMRKLTDLVIERNCPHFVMAYNLAVCDNCRVVGLFGDAKIDLKNPSCYATFMEKAHGDMHSLDTKDGEKQKSIFYQLLIALYAIEKLGIYHADIKKENILLQVINPGGVFRYNIGKETFYVKNCGVFAMLADFGVAINLSPLNKANYYGVRNAKVVSNDAGDVVFQPFTTRFSFSEGRTEKSEAFVWDNGLESTENIFYKNRDSKPSIAVDLADMCTFPPFEFFHDLQDIVRIFCGGKCTYRRQKHLKLKTLDKKFKEQLLKFAYRDMIYPWPIDSVRFFRADVMLKHVYQHWETQSTPQSVLSTFTL